MLLKVRYQSRIFHRDVGWKSMGDAGLKLFPPSIKPLLYALKTHLFVHFKGRGLATHLFMDFPQYLLTLKHHSSIPIYQRQGQSQAIALTNAELSLIGHLGAWLQWNLNQNTTISKETDSKMFFFTKWLLYCLALNLLTMTMTMKYFLLTWSYIMFIQYTKQHTCNHYTIFISWRQVNVSRTKNW